MTTASRSVVIRSKAIDVMRSGGQRICDEAIDKWWAGKYRTDETQQQEMIAQWKEVKEAISDLCRELK